MLVRFGDYVHERWGLVLKIIRERGSGPHFKQQSMVGLEQQYLSFIATLYAIQAIKGIVDPRMSLYQLRSTTAHQIRKEFLQTSCIFVIYIMNISRTNNSQVQFRMARNVMKRIKYTTDFSLNTSSGYGHVSSSKFLSLRTAYEPRW